MAILFHFFRGLEDRLFTRTNLCHLTQQVQLEWNEVKILPAQCHWLTFGVAAHRHRYCMSFQSKAPSFRHTKTATFALGFSYRDKRKILCFSKSWQLNDAFSKRTLPSKIQSRKIFLQVFGGESILLIHYLFTESERKENKISILIEYIYSHTCRSVTSFTSSFTW